MFRNIFPTFSSKIVGDGGDTPIFVWNLWWAKKALIDLKINPLHTDYLFYPSGTSLVFHTLTLTSGVFSIVFQYFMSLTQTFNLLFLMNFVASGILTFWVLRKMKMDYIGSAFGGLVFALAPPIVAQTIGHTNLYSVWFIPAILLATIYFLEKPNWRSSIFLALALALSIHNDYYVACYAILLAVIYLIVFVLSKEIKNWKNLGKYALATLALLLIFLSPIIYELYGPGKSLQLPPTETGGYAFYAGDLAGFLTPSFLNPERSDRYSAANLHNVRGTEGVNYIGLIPVILAILAIIFVILRRDKDEKKYYIYFALAGLVICLLLTLGPTPFLRNQVFSPSVFGHKLNLGFLYLIFGKIPVYKNLRVAIRFMIPAMLCLAVLCAYAITSVNRLTKIFKVKVISYLLMGIIGFILFILVIGEYQTSLKFYDLNLSSVYQVIANDHDDVRVMDLPFRQKTGRSWEMGKGFSKQQYAQTLHQKKLLSGYISYTDESVKAPVLSTPGVHYLATNFDDESESDKDPQLAKEGFAKYQVRYIVLSKKDGSAGEWYQMSQDKIDLADQYIKETLKGKIISQDENTILYRLDGI